MPADQNDFAGERDFVKDRVRHLLNVGIVIGKAIVDGLGQRDR